MIESVNAKALNDFLSILPKRNHIRLGILLPSLPDAANAIKAAVKQEWIVPVLLGNKKDQELFSYLSGVDAESITAENALQALEIAINEEKIQALLRGEAGVHNLFATLLRMPSFRIGWISQVALLHLNSRTFLLSDAAVTLLPTLEQKVKIVENAIRVARVIGFDPPKVALLAAVETISTDIPVGMHDAILAKMSERGQFGNALLEGPLALDLAISEDAAKKKKVKSPVAGNANVLIAPNLEVGNGLYKALITLAGAASASVVVGGSIPIALPSRSDSIEAFINSILLTSILS
ncbi:MAG: phosphate acyltransferase [bacterium]|nr:phosphate acyltransferase [bacterium]